MGRPELADDPNYADHFARGDRQRELDDLIGEWSRSLTTQETLDLMEEHAVPAGRIYKAADMLEDPHYAARDAIVEVDHPSYKKLFMQNIFPKLSETPGNIQCPGPELGQHNKEVYEDMLGITPSRLEELKAAGVI